MCSTSSRRDSGNLAPDSAAYDSERITSYGGFHFRWLAGSFENLLFSSRLGPPEIEPVGRELNMTKRTRSV
jgi:hypothetical protein